MINFLMPLQEPHRLWESLWILLGIWANYQLYLMIKIEIKYGKGVGELFLIKGKEYIKKNYGGF